MYALAVVGTACAAVFIFLALVQLGSLAVFSRVGTPGSLPARLSPRAGEAIYRVIARVAPAPYALDMLARSAFDRHDLPLALAYARRLPQGYERAEWLAVLALARGDRRAAREYFLQAGDAEAVQGEIDRLAASDAHAAIVLEARLIARLQRERDHPDGVADATWHLGLLYARLREPQQALESYRRASALSPIAAKYLLAAAFQEYDLHSYAQAQRDFAAAIDVDPANADAYAGAGMVALQRGDRIAAGRYAQRSESINPHGRALKTLLTRLQ